MFITFNKIIESTDLENEKRWNSRAFNLINDPEMVEKKQSTAVRLICDRVSVFSLPSRKVLLMKITTSVFSTR